LGKSGGFDPFNAPIEARVPQRRNGLKGFFPNLANSRRMLVGFPKHHKTVSMCMKREPVVEKSRAVMESRYVPTNAEGAILTNESGRSRGVRRKQLSKTPAGIFGRLDGD
jgi:hypothetical protein